MTSDNEWSVGLMTAAGEGQSPVRKLPDRLGSLLDSLVDRGGVATSTSDSRRYGARFCVTAAGPTEALQQAVAIFRQAASAADLPEWPLIEAEVLTTTELDRQNALPSLPELVGVTEVAELLEVSRQRASALARSGTFPSPVVVLRSGPVWTRASVDRFVESWRRRPGRTAS